MAASAAGDALQQQLWPFAEGTFASQLLQLLPLPQFVQLYHSLLLLADSARPNGSRSSSSGSSSLAGQAATARLLSALAFGTQLLARLWRHLATSIGLPLEAPMQASCSAGCHSKHCWGPCMTAAFLTVSLSRVVNRLLCCPCFACRPREGGKCPRCAAA